MQTTLQNIAAQHKLDLKKVVSLSGGDINEVFLLECTFEKFVIKVNAANKFPAMFEAEAKGLAILEATNSFKIPKVRAVGIHREISYLLMEHISPGNPSTTFWEEFASCLVKLHRTTQKTFGLNHDNYIGSLPQFNNTETTNTDFYINQRLKPQLRTASNKGYRFSKMDIFYKNIESEIPNEPSSLIHGDLWSGNYLVSQNDRPTLIDPAVSFASREMDIAMMKLFGGFAETTYGVYEEQFPMKNNWQDRVDIWQLYYLLVHLNLFGAGYYTQVKAIVDRYS